MKRATITLPDDLEHALEQFVEEQQVPVQLTAVVQAAVREYLAELGYLETSSALRIRPAKRGSCSDLQTSAPQPANIAIFGPD